MGKVLWAIQGQEPGQVASIKDNGTSSSTLGTSRLDLGAIGVGSAMNTRIAWMKSPGTSDTMQMVWFLSRSN